MYINFHAVFLDAAHYCWRFHMLHSYSYH